MRKHTHLSFALLCGSITILFYNPPSKILFIAATVITSLLPDIDEWSLESRRGVISLIIKTIFGHRGLFHSLIIPAVALFLLWSIIPHWLLLAFILGYISHIILDSLTPMGTKLFWPFQYRVRGFIPTGTILEKILMIICIILSAVIWIGNIWN